MTRARDRQGTYLIAILAIAVLLRVGVAFHLGDTVPDVTDETSYSALGGRLAAGYGCSFPVGWYPFTPANTPTSHWSFLYTGFVAAVYAAAGPHPLAARLAQALLAGLLMPWLTYRLTKRLQVGGWGLQAPGSRLQAGGSRFADEPSTFNLQPALPLLAAGLAAVYAYFVLYGAMVQTEAFFICGLLWSLERGLAADISLRQRERIGTRDALVLGLSVGVTVLLRQSILPWAAVMFGWLAIRGLKREGSKIEGWTRRSGRRLGPLVVAGAVVVGCIVPFTVRNYAVYGGFLLLNSNAGYAMYSAQHPMHGTDFQEYAAAPLPEDLVGKGLNEAGWDKELMRRGIGFVLAEPGRYLLLSLSRVRDFFEFWPTAGSSTLFNLGRVASIGLFLPFMLAGIYLSLSRKSSIFDLGSSIFLAAFMAFYSVLHIFTWAMSRYRLPVDAVALPFAALAIAFLWEKAARRRTVAVAPRVEG